MNLHTTLKVSSFLVFLVSYVLGIFILCGFGDREYLVLCILCGMVALLVFFLCVLSKRFR